MLEKTVESLREARREDLTELLWDVERSTVAAGTARTYMSAGKARREWAERCGVSVEDSGQLAVFMLDRLSHQASRSSLAINIAAYQYATGTRLENEVVDTIVKATGRRRSQVRTKEAPQTCMHRIMDEAANEGASRDLLRLRSTPSFPRVVKARGRWKSDGGFEAYLRDWEAATTGGLLL